MAILTYIYSNVKTTIIFQTNTRGVFNVMSALVTKTDNDTTPELSFYLNGHFVTFYFEFNLILLAFNVSGHFIDLKRMIFKH